MIARIIIASGICLLAAGVDRSDPTVAEPSKRVPVQLESPLALAAPGDRTAPPSGSAPDLTAPGDDSRAVARADLPSAGLSLSGSKPITKKSFWFVHSGLSPPSPRD